MGEGIGTNNKAKKNNDINVKICAKLIMNYKTMNLMNNSEIITEAIAVKKNKP